MYTEYLFYHDSGYFLQSTDWEAFCRDPQYWLEQMICRDPCSSEADDGWLVTLAGTLQSDPWVLYLDGRVHGIRRPIVFRPRSVKAHTGIALAAIRMHVDDETGRTLALTIREGDRFRHTHSPNRRCIYLSQSFYFELLAPG